MNNNPAKDRWIGEPQPLTREDLGKLYSGAFRPVITTQRIRYSHHRVARLVATGLRDFEIAERTGYSPNRIFQLKQSPAFKDLVEQYKSKVDAAFEASTEAFYDMATDNMRTAERMIADRLEDAEAADKPIPIKDLLAISRDAADRFGYGKKHTNFNVKGDFAAELEKAVARSGKAEAVAKIVESSPNVVRIRRR